MWFFGKDKVEIEKRETIKIRLEAIGGQGANLAGKIIADAAVFGMGYSANHFSSFGSEKRGTPVKSFVRYNVNQGIIRSSSPISKPDVLVVFHESLIQAHKDCLDGMSVDTHLIINTEKNMKTFHLPEGSSARTLGLINASQISTQLKCGLNSVLLGAILKVCPEIQVEKLEDAIKKFFAKFPIEIQERNLEGFWKGYKSIEINPFHKVKVDAPISSSVRPELGWADAPLGGTITTPGNMSLIDNSASRKGTMPKFLREVCFDCGYCDMVCPDYCFEWNTNEKGQPHLEGINYQYCKGCQKCVDICPVNALVLVSESTGESI